VNNGTYTKVPTTTSSESSESTGSGGKSKEGSATIPNKTELSEEIKEASSDLADAKSALDAA